jgi:hypothetical protein
MSEQTVRKTCKYKLYPTPEQDRELGRVLGLCRALYTVALEQRITAWQRLRLSVSRYQQEAELYQVCPGPCLFMMRRGHQQNSVVERIKSGRALGVDTALGLGVLQVIDRGEVTDW